MKQWSFEEHHILFLYHIGIFVGYPNMLGNDTVLKCMLTRGGWTATRKASWEICMRFANWLHSRVDLSEVNISRIWKFSKDETIRL